MTKIEQEETIMKAEAYDWLEEVHNALVSSIEDFLAIIETRIDDTNVAQFVATQKALAACRGEDFDNASFTNSLETESWYRVALKDQLDTIKRKEAAIKAWHTIFDDLRQENIDLAEAVEYYKSI
jgi:predicted outer membrane protein